MKYFTFLLTAVLLTSLSSIARDSEINDRADIEKNAEILSSLTDGLAPTDSIFLGDMKFTVEQAWAYWCGGIEKNSNENWNRKPQGVVQPGVQKWTDNTIRYYFDESITESQRAIFRNEISKWDIYGSFTFEELSGPSGNCIKVFFESESKGNYSNVGMVGGVQELHLNSKAWTTDKAAIAHEWGHALGLGHEHQRPDRDNYIEILSSSELEAAGISPALDENDPWYLGNYLKYTNAQTYGEYDYKSIMHYGGLPRQVGNNNCVFLLESNNGHVGYRTINPELCDPNDVGNDSPHTSDFNAVHEFYGIDISTPSEAIPISSIEQLQLIGNDPAYPSFGNYVLVQNLDASSTASWNGGAGFKPVTLSGVFDGQGHTIFGLTINRPSEDNIGLFGFVSSQGQVKNLGVVGGTVTGNMNVGGLVGDNAGVVNSCFSTNRVSGFWWNVGGLIGQNNEGSIRTSYSTGAVSGQSPVGGLVGKNNNGNVSACFSLSIVSGVSSVGGLIGWNRKGVVEECYAIGAVAANEAAGNLVGYNDGGVVNSSFWNIGVLATNGVNSGSGISLDQFLQSNTFEGWDYSTVWTQVDSQTVPHFQWDQTSDQYSLNVSLEGNGSVNGAANPIAESHTAWSVVTLQAGFDAGFVFAGWLGDGVFSDAGIRAELLPVIMHQNMNLRALFIPDSPIPITNISNLQKIGHDPAWPPFANYQLEANLDASETATWNAGKGFDPIGSIDAVHSFSGVFDGQGHTISGLTINRPDERWTGLFSAVDFGEIKNLGLLGGTIKGSWGAGGLVGQLNGSKLTTCFTTSEVSGSYDVGGLAGVIAPNELSVVSGCYATGAVLGGDEAGGLIGENGLNGLVNGCYATGAVSGSLVVGGLVGSNWGTIANSYASGTVSGSDKVGGLVGEIYVNRVVDSYSTGAVSGLSNIGGLIGSTDLGGRATSSYWDIQTSGQTVSAGGGEGKSTNEMKQAATYVGWNFSSLWDLSPEANNGYPYFNLRYVDSPFPIVPLGSGTLTDPYQINRLEHLVWMSETTDSSFKKHYQLMSDIDASETATWNDKNTDPYLLEGFSPIGNNYNRFDGIFDGGGKKISGLVINRLEIGGVGLFGNIFANSIIMNLALENAQVSGNGSVGGLVGVNWGEVNRCYMIGKVIGAISVGGLVGENIQSGKVNESFAVATVSGSGNVGGLVGGSISIEGAVNKSYWDLQISGQATSIGGEGKSTNEMKQAATYEEWDFSYVWTIQEGISYPQFIWPFPIAPTATPSPTPIAPTATPSPTPIPISGYPVSLGDSGETIVGLGKIKSVDFSADGNLIATSGYNGTYIWSVDEERLIKTFMDYPNCTNIKFSPDGGALVLHYVEQSEFSETSKAFLIDVETGNIIRDVSLGTDYSSIHSLAFSPDGTKFVISDFFSKMKVFDSSGQELQSIALSTELIAIAFSPDNQSILVVNNSGGANQLVKADVNTGQITETITLSGLSEAMTPWTENEAAIFSADGTRLIGSSLNEAIVWDTANGAVLQTLAEKPRGMGISSNGQKIAIKEFVQDGYKNRLKIKSGDSDIQLWEARATSGQLALQFSENGNSLLEQVGASIRVWDANAGSVISTFSGHSDFYAFEFSSDAGRAITNLNYGAFGIINLLNGNIEHEFATATGWVHFSPDRLKAFIGTDLYEVSSWERLIQSPIGTKHKITPDNRSFLSIYGKELKVFDLASGNSNRSIAIHDQFGLADYDISPNGDQVATINSDDKTLRLWDFVTGEELWRTDYPNASADAGTNPKVAFSPDGNYLLAEFDDFYIDFMDFDDFGSGSVKIWNVNTKEVVLDMNPDYTIASIAWHPDSSKFLLGNKEYDLSGQILGTYSSIESTQQFLGHYSHDGAKVIVGAFADQGTVQVWNSGVFFPPTPTPTHTPTIIPTITPTNTPENTPTPTLVSTPIPTNTPVWTPTPITIAQKWNFDRENDSEGWFSVNVAQIKVSEGLISGVAETDDPILFYNGVVETQYTAGLAFRYRSNQENTIQVFVIVENDEPIFMLIGDLLYDPIDGFQTYIIHFTPEVEQYDNIIQLRIDPSIYQDSYFELDWVGLISNGLQIPTPTPLIVPTPTVTETPVQVKILEWPLHQ